MTNLRGVYCTGVDTWLKTAPSFSSAKILWVEVISSCRCYLYSSIIHFNCFDCIVMIYVGRGGSAVRARN